MITGILCSVFCFGYLFLCFRFARKEYTKRYAAQRDQLGATARSVALGDAYIAFAFWPVSKAWRMFDRLITSPGFRKPDQHVIDTIEQEIYGEQKTADATCPCGWVTECPIWCGDGSCHKERIPGSIPERGPANGENPFARWAKYQKDHGYPVSVGTEIIRSFHPEAYLERDATGKIVIDDPGCQCRTCKGRS